jgi:hypothetical protein
MLWLVPKGISFHRRGPSQLPKLTQSPKLKLKNKKIPKIKNPTLSSIQIPIITTHRGAKKEKAMEESSTSDSESKILETLRSRGWCLGDIDQLKAIIMIHSALADDASTVVDSVESELTNMDLKSIGAKSLPDPTLPRKPSHILGPKVLQVTLLLTLVNFSLGLCLFTEKMREIE